jgi:hypothetical protein
MSHNNLRIITHNQVTSVNNSFTAKSLNDYKSQYDTGGYFLLNIATPSNYPLAIVAILLEDVGPITMTVDGHGSIAEVTSSSYINQTIGFGGVKYIVKYITPEPGQTQFGVSFPKSVKVSKFIIGNYWSPKYNTGYGMQVGYDDASTSERLQSGDLYTTKLPRNKTLQFDLQYMDETDKFHLFDIIKSVGKTDPIFVSIFPESTDQEKEQMYSIYGKFNSLPNISHTMFSMYSSSLQLEEI